jgi:O-antigen ligase
MEIISYSIFLLLALGAAIAVVLALGLGFHFDRIIRQYFVSLIPILIALAIGTSSIASDRNVSFYGLSGADMAMSAGWLGGWILRSATAMIVGASVVVTLAAFVRRDFGGGAGAPLILLFLAYFASCYVVSGVFGSEPSFSHNHFYAPFLFIAAYVTRDQSADSFIRRSRDGLNIFIIMGLIVGAILPHIAVQKGYVGLIPGLTFRFWGVASHANNLGPIAVIFLLLLAWKPYRWLVLNVICVAAALVSLFLSQSKTAWIAGTAGLVVLLGYHIISNIRGAKIGKKVTISQFAWISGPLILAFGLSVAFGVGIMLGFADRALTHLSSEPSLLTGRDLIWLITLNEWEANPLFGHGPSLWGSEFAARKGYLGVASNAHNQFVDVLGSSGIVGILCFSAYFLLLLKYAWSLASHTRGIALAMAVFVLFRCITEVPLKTANITTTDFLIHFILFTVLLRAKSMLADAPVRSSKRSRLTQASFSSL